MFFRMTQTLFTVLAAVILALGFPRAADVQAAGQAVLYAQPPSAAGGLIQSSWLAPNGTDYDQFIWERFSFPAPRTLTEIRWRGGFDPSRNGSGGPVTSFTISIYASIPAGSQPDIITPPLVEYVTSGNAGETLAGTFGGVAMYDYASTLPAPFTAAAGTLYWVQIVANQAGDPNQPPVPDWGLAKASAGDGSHFRQMAAAGDKYYLSVSGDAAFTLLGDPPSGFAFSLPLVTR